MDRAVLTSGPVPGSRIAHARFHLVYHIYSMSGNKGFNRSLALSVVLVLAGALLALPATAQEEDGSNEEDSETTEQTETEEEPSVDETVILPDTVVVGSEENLRTLPGAGHLLETEDIRDHSYDDINRVLRKVPGVHIREEDGFGLFPNISLRGVDPGRSGKLTLMADGILQAPAPYSAPSAYHSPTTGRMHSIEVLKGSSQVQYGPHTTGGVINYVSTPIPSEQKIYSKTIYGEHNEIRSHAYIGDTINLENGGSVGYLVEGYVRENDGFKEFNPTTPDFTGGSTGLENTNMNVKLSWEPDWVNYHRFEAKYGYTDRNANETYLGLNESDFRSQPFTRYPASRDDRFESRQNRSYLKHYGEFSDTFSLEQTLYYNNFKRNWEKLHELRDSVGGNSVSLSKAVAGLNNGNYLEVLRGERAGVLNIRANNRSYYSWGYQVTPRFEFDQGNVSHNLELGLRIHNDRIRRFQWSTDIEQNSDGVWTNRTRYPGGSAGNRLQETYAYAFHIRDEIETGRWTITPGLRFEHLQQDWEEYADNPNNTVVDEGDGSLNMIGGGIGATYSATEQVDVFGGIHRGFSPPSPRGNFNNDLDEETSLALELGGRYASNDDHFTGEATLFFTDFQDLIANQNIGATGTDQTGNFGAVDYYGAEMMLEYDATGPRENLSVPLFLSATFSQAKLTEDIVDTDPESIFSGGEEGDDVPYIPDIEITAGAEVEYSGFRASLTGNWRDEMFGTANNAENQQDLNGNPDARFGTIESRFTTDLSLEYQVHENASVTGGVHNLFDNEYMVSRLPHGPRAGKSRTTYLGMELDF